MSSASCVLTERHLRHLWLRQEFLRTPLITADGQPVVVLHPGTLNLQSGPDFLDARIRIGHVLLAGDVEFHRHCSDWSAHHHDADPHYNSVILHVVLEADRSASTVITACGRSVPSLFLAPFLAVERSRIDHQLQLDERARVALTIPCADLNYEIPASLMRGWISTLARERLELKMQRMADRLLSLTSRPREQVFYEALMDGLGYSQNRIPFMKLSTILTLDEFDRLGIIDTPLLIEAMLFGVSGLLPASDSFPDEQTRTYARRLHEAWNALRHRHRGEILSPADWSFSPNRPSNSPSRRLAQAAALIYAILRHDLVLNIAVALASRADAIERHRRIAAMLALQPSPYWRTHLDFGGRNDPSNGIIGRDRIDALLMNVIVPFGWMISQTAAGEACREGTLQLWQTIPASSGNHVTRMMEWHLIRGRISLTHAHEEQGLIHLHHFYCRRERCAECAIGMQIGLGSRIIGFQGNLG